MEAIKRYIISYNLPPEERWLELLEIYKDDCLEVINYVEKMMDSSKVGKFLKKAILSIIKSYNNYETIKFKDELTAIAKFMGLRIEKVIMMQFFFELTSGCTSAIFDYGGTNIHFRTFDLEVTILKKILVEIEFTKNGKTLFVAPTWVGYVGIITGLLPQQYSIAVNFRPNANEGNIFENMFYAIKKAINFGWPVGYVIRDILDSNMSVNDAIDYIGKTNTLSTSYIVICESSNNSHLIIKDTNKILDKKSFIGNFVQTNHDDENKKVNYIYSVERELMVKEIFDDECNKWEKYQDILDSFNKYPIINELTIFKSLLHPYYGTLITKIIPNNTLPTIS